VDADALIERTAAAVAGRYRDLDLGNAAGLLLDTYYDGAPEQLAPLALELRAGEVTADVDRDGYQRELEVPIAEQLRRQLKTAARADPLAGLDVAVTVAIDGQRIAAVWRQEMSLWGSARVPAEPWPLGWNTLLGSDPEVRAGVLPPGAVGASVRDRAGAWHQARTGAGAWLCALPQRAGQDDSPVLYRDIEGNEFTLELDLGRLPGLWPAQAAVTPELTQHGSDLLGYSAGGWHVFIEAHAGREDTTFRPLPGTVLGRPHGFGIEQRNHGWRAVAICGSITVEVQSDGQPPSRLDLEAVPHD
jgi:hypothetical protein